MEAMETEYIELLEGVTTGDILDSFVTDMVVPGLPKEVRFRSKHPFQMAHDENQDTTYGASSPGG
jgi:hypothetical protein